MGKIKEEIVEELLSAKTEFEFRQIIRRENIPTEYWYKEPNMRGKFEYLKRNAGISVYDNIGFLREKNK